VVHFNACIDGEGEMGAFHIVAPPAFGSDSKHWLAGKLNPMFFPGILPEFVAIVGFVVEAGYTRPGLCRVTVNEGYVVAELSDAEDSALCSYEFLSFP
jgi:hypothetical protein